MRKTVLLLLCFVVAGVFADGGALKASMLRAGDVLSVSVFRVQEFSKTVRVEEDGTFHYPLCGDIKAAGLTPRDVARELETRLAKQIAEPQVDVFVTQWSARKVYILGEVTNSLSLDLPTNGGMTALQAISAAGGFRQSADLNNVAVLRRDEQNRLVRHKIDVSALVSRSSGGDDFVLRPEDTLIVPKAPPVYIAGSIKNPTVFFIDTQRPPLLSEVVIRAGGMIAEADPGTITVLREDAQGVRQPLQGSLLTDEHNSYVNDIAIQAGDSILVSSAAQIYVLGEVKKPGPLTLAPGKRLTARQAIALAGGFTDLSKQSDITLIRGQKFQKINLRKLYSSEDNLTRDIELQYGDILFIKESIF